MRTLVLALLLVPVGTFAAQRVTIQMCLHEERVTITEINGRIELANRSPRTTSILVRVPVSCKNGRNLSPRDHNQAVEWLDISLPLDLKAALLYGDYAEPFKTSDYGASVMDDLYLHLTDKWALNNTSPVCIAPVIKKKMQPYETPCFYVLIDLLREKYLKGAAMDQK
jgi:hypothetical protein